LPKDRRELSSPNKLHNFQVIMVGYPRLFPVHSSYDAPIEFDGDHSLIDAENGKQFFQRRRRRQYSPLAVNFKGYIRFHDGNDTDRLGDSSSTGSTSPDGTSQPPLAEQLIQ
jgi:hypothetical protein